MKRLSQTTQFGKDIKLAKKRGKDLRKIQDVVLKLAEGRILDSRHRDHPLVGNWLGCRECHIEGDWLLIYTSDATSLRLERTGTHSDLFQK